MRSKVDVRLGPELLGRVEQFQAENGAASLSAAVRVLVQLGLERGAELDGVWRKLAYREGVVSATAAFKRAVEEAVDKAMTVGGVR